MRWGQVFPKPTEPVLLGPLGPLYLCFLSVEQAIPDKTLRWPE